MTVTELIAELQKFPPNLVVKAQDGGNMSDWESVEIVELYLGNKGGDREACIKLYTF